MPGVITFTSGTSQRTMRLMPSSMRPIRVSLAEVVLTVRDLEAAVRFYRDTLGLTVISPEGARGAVFLRVGDDQVVPHQLVLAPASSGTPGIKRKAASYSLTAAL